MYFHRFIARPKGLRFVIDEIRAKYFNFVENNEAIERYPGVTRILNSTSDKTWVEEWRAKIGPEKADEILAESHRIGTCLDKKIEGALGGEEFKPEEHDPEALKESVKLFRQLKPTLDRIEPILLQPKLWSDHLKSFGYADCLGNLDNVLTMIDFKNARKLRTDEQLQNYYLQATFYSLMLYDMIGIFPQQIAILVAVRNDAFPQIRIRQTSLFIPEVVKRSTAYYADTLPE